MLNFPHDSKVLSPEKVYMKMFTIIFSNLEISLLLRVVLVAAFWVTLIQLKLTVLIGIRTKALKFG
jgi:hypothetical protein